MFMRLITGEEKEAIVYEMPYLSWLVSEVTMGVMTFATREEALESGARRNGVVSWCAVQCIEALGDTSEGDLRWSLPPTDAEYQAAWETGLYDSDPETRGDFWVEV